MSKKKDYFVDDMGHYVFFEKKVLMSWDKYVIKKRFRWFFVYENNRLHAKFRYQASAANYLHMKKEQYRIWEDKQ